MALLRQTFGDFELIIVNDASKDDSLVTLQALAAQDDRIKLISHDRNLGASRTRNDGLRAARGEFVAFCDADDLWKPGKLEAQIKLLGENPSCDATYCDSEIIDETDRVTGELFSQQFPPPQPASGNLFPALCVRNFVNMQTVLLRREAVGELLYFDEGIKWVEDWWQWIRLAHKHRFCYDERPLAQYRVHSQSTGRTQRPGIRVNRWRVCRRNLRTHPDLSTPMQAQLWYMMGLELHQMGRRHLARRFFCRATCLGFHKGTPLKTLVKMISRLCASSLGLPIATIH